jgi:cation diffusion facilitator CzcD-associated flavoprotein CzcO
MSLAATPTPRAFKYKATATLLAISLIWFASKWYKRQNERTKERRSRIRTERCEAREFRVAIIGGGMSGVCQAIALQAAGVPFEILEQEKDYGGTWAKNTYPDAACDVPSHFYSYSFEYKWDWERVWAKQPDILLYFRHIADKYGLRQHTRFGVRVLGATFEQDKSLWRVETDSGPRTYNVVISAVGQLDRPKWPLLPGLEHFQGARFHTAEWDHSVALEGKNVVGVGTGPSAIQAFPKIAPTLKHLTVCQRTPVWVTNKDDYLYPTWFRWALLNIPGLYWASETHDIYASV